MGCATVTSPLNFISVMHIYIRHSILKIMWRIIPYALLNITSGASTIYAQQNNMRHKKENICDKEICYRYSKYIVVIV
jgi:hypothetical protein